MRALIALLAILILPWLPAQALESAAQESPRARVTLVADHLAIAPGQAFQLGLRIRLAPRWHSYWRHAGDAGAPTEINLTLPEGTQAGPIAWPTPQAIPFGPLMSFGYYGEVVLPMQITPPAGLRARDVFSISAQATWLVCDDVCIPEEGSFRLDLPVAAEAQANPDLAPLFAAAAAALPRPSPWQASATIQGDALRLRLTGPGLGRESLKEALFIPGTGGLLDHAAPQRLSHGADWLELTLRRADRPENHATLEGVLLLTDQGGRRLGYDIAAPLLTGAAFLPLWQALIFALIGGVILNLMPCVFPVLAMKAMALARLGGAARGAVRLEAAAYTAGAVVSFTALAGLLLALRGAGMALGWGFQFTSPVFVLAIAWLMLAVGLNLSGVFALGGPIGAGGHIAARGGFLGSFATGALAVLVASPCTAPFMAAAIGAALVMPAPATLAVFAALGLGLAAPTLILALAPGLTRLLPRPGPWMEKLRRIMAWPMYGAALWLVWVLWAQSGWPGVALALVGGLGLGLGAWTFGRAQREGRRRLGPVLAALALLLALPFGLTAAPPPPTASDTAESWNPARVEALRAEGKGVFLNVTAAWCITCQVNERIALRRDAVQAAMAARGIVYLKADWTRGDPAITALLRSHGREGVPLYLFWPPGGGEAVILPEVLTEAMVLRQIAAQ
ncbi:MAG: protein-disulfide reductase DsbD family protein [Alphaproteobacteria bacterium]|nr:protein-disulfide reductase DsbD family protein [Alphaproteobacteria bacterium]